MRYNESRCESDMEVITIDSNESIIAWEDHFDEEYPQIANMDQYDFMVLLMESRIIPAS